MAENTPTPNYNFNLPLVGGDDDVWGDLLNENWSNIDGILWTVSGVASAALTPITGDARYLRLTGGTLGPNSLIVNGPASFTNYTQVTGQFASSGGASFGTGQVFFNSQVTFSADALMVTPAPTDNSQRAATTSWVTAVLGSRGYITDAPNDGHQYARQNAAWAVVTSGGGGIADAPSDGTAYARKSAGWANLAHTDITDWTATLAPYALTTSVPVAATTLPLANGVATVGTSTAYARADHVHPLTSIGDNRIINGNFAINQRGYVSGTALAAAAYGHDRWKAGTGGCTYTFTAAVPDTTITITAGTLTQVIEAGMIEGGVYTLSWTGTAQARVYQGTPTGAYAASPLITAALTGGTNTIVEFNAGTLVRAKLEIGSIATPFNRQSLAKSLADCQRYYQVGIAQMAGYSAGQGAYNQLIMFPVQMRAAPTMTPTWGAQTGGTGAVAPTGGQSGLGFQFGQNITVAAGTTYNIWASSIAFSAEL